MVPLGDPRVLENPFDVNCAAAGSPRWVDSRTWAYDFESPLPGGLACDFTLRNGLRALSGDPVEGGKVFSFTTGGPEILSTDPYRGSTVAEDSAFLLRLDAPVAEESLDQHAYFGVEGVGERVGVVAITGPEREQVLETLPPSSRGGELLLLRARQAFPPEARIELVWGEGLETTSGVARASDQKIAFQVRKAFHATLECTREKPQGPCVPLRPIRIRFSEPVAWEAARGAIVVDPHASFEVGAEPWLGDESQVRGLLFPSPLPPARTLEVQLPDGLRDEDGRELENAGQFPLQIATGPYPPLAKFAARFGILEASANPALPVTVRSLGPELHARLLETQSGLAGRVQRVGADEAEALVPWLRRVRRARRDTSVFQAETSDARATPREVVLPLPGKPEETEVVGIPLEKPGLYVVEIESKPLGKALLGKDQPMYVSSAALVTNLAVHLKHGLESSLAWVTELDSGTPADAVAVHAYDCTGKLLASGFTNADGIALLPDLPGIDTTPSCRAKETGEPNPWRDWRGGNEPFSGLDSGVFVTARRGDDLSFVFSSWQQGIEPWRFGIYELGWARPAGLHTIFGRTLLRAGETVHMKHLARWETAEGFAIPPREALPAVATIEHTGSGTTIELPLDWQPDGSATSTWAIPPSAKLGTYEVYLEPGPDQTAAPEAQEAGDDPEHLHVYRPLRASLSGRSGSFRVEEFRVPLMSAVVKTPAEAQVGVTEVPVNIALRYLAGGAAGRTTVVLRSELAPTTIEAPAAFRPLLFGNGPVAVGIERHPTYRHSPDPSPHLLERIEVSLDDEGTAEAQVTNLPQIDRPQRLTAEVEYRDPNGETQTSSASTTLWPAEHAVGIRVEDWVGSTGRLVIEAAVIDPAGQPVAGADVEVRAYSRRNYTSRKRVVGGFYAYESVQETTFTNTVCTGQTDEQGKLVCRRRPPADGELVLEARTLDEDGRTSTAHQSVWVFGEDDAWFRPSDTDRMEIIPERVRYEPGETARLQIRAPFPRSTALVTVEREGVLHSWVTQLEGTNPVLDVPVSGKMAPNVYVSVLAIRGRVSEPRPTATIDLGKPSFRLGLTELEVGWQAHALDVTVSTDKSVYRVRETAEVDVEVRDVDGNPPPPDSEITIAAVDDGLLALVPNPSWNLLRAMMGDRPESVQTSTAQMQVVGKRHFGRKAVPAGGGGGRKPTRELFDTLLLWDARVPLDPDGRARVSIPLNDSLTSFRVVAIATGGSGLFGSGRTTIRTTQDLMIFSGLPPVIRAGDEVWSEFTVRNTTDRTIDVQLTAHADGLREGFPPQDFRLSSGEARSRGWSSRIPGRVQELDWEVAARDIRGEATDRLHVTQKVRPAVPVRTRQASFEQWSRPGPLRQPISAPHGALPGEGGVEVTLAASLADGLAGVRAWMQEYPYGCLEQKVSQAIALDDDARWSSILQTLPSHLDRTGLLKFFPGMDDGSPVLTAYVLEVAELASRPLPRELRDRMETALVRFVQGKTRHSTSGPALGLRKLAVLSALAQAGRATEELTQGLTIEPERWPTTSVLDWWNVLRALPELPEREARLADVEKIVRARLFEQGSTLTVSEGGGSTWWLLANQETDALRLVLLLLDADTWSDDVPKLMRGAIGLQERGAWSTTVANALGALAVTRFTEVFEGEPVSGSTVLSLAGHAQQVDWVRHPEGETLSFPWPTDASELTVQHQGAGQPWVLTRARAAVPLTEPVGSGFWIRRDIVPDDPRSDGTLRVGDTLTVRLEIEAASGQGWVVVEDPVPAGTSFLGRSFASKPEHADAASGDAVPAFIERSFESYRAYYERLSPGTFALEYRVRLNQAGLFHPPPTRVEAMYAPEAFAELPQAPVRVER